MWLIHHPNEFDPKRGELGAFLVGIARKLLKKRYAEQQRWVGLVESAPSCAASPAEQNEVDYDRLLVGAIAALPERYRAVVVLCDLEERTYEEAAAIVECAVGTVRSRLHRARAMLARKIVGRGGSMSDRLRSAMDRLAADGGKADTPPEMEAALLAEFYREKLRKKRTSWVFVAGTVAASLLAALAVQHRLTLKPGAAPAPPDRGGSGIGAAVHRASLYHAAGDLTSGFESSAWSCP